jgi:phage shock protein A
MIRHRIMESIVAESILERVSRILSGRVEDTIVRLEQADGPVVMREAIREVDRVIEQVRADHEAVMTRRLQAARQLKMLDEHVSQLTDKARFAVGQGRDDLAEAALSRQIDFEQQAAKLAAVQAVAREDETRLDNSITALEARKKQMEDALSSFVVSQREADTGGDGPTQPARNVDKQVKRSEQAFERAMAGAGGVGFTRAAADTINRVAEIDGLQKSASITARMAKLKQSAGAG